MRSERARGLWLLLLGVVTGLLALAALTVVALAAAPDRSAGVSMAFPVPYATVVEAVRAVSADGVIRGTYQYESDTAINGANKSGTSPAFPRWAGAGEVFYKTRPGAIAPSHFAGSRDRGAVTVRYVVEPGQAGQTRVTIDAVFVEESHHGRHPSQGSVEKAEFDEIGEHLKNSGVPGKGLAPEALKRAPEPQNPVRAVQAPSQERQSEPDRPAPAAAEVQSAPLGRTYLRSEEDLRKALRKLGAFDAAATLPVLEGFATDGPESPGRYDRPYYQFRIEFAPAGPGRTTVRIEAVVTARYTDAARSRPEYRSVPSNGRLEADLFDRLEGYLRSETGAPASGAAGVRQQAAKAAEKIRQGVNQ